MLMTSFARLLLNILQHKTLLVDRRQCAVIHNQSSELIAVKYGVPQGSILGSLLFIAYVNDLVRCGLKEKMLPYADDAGGEVKTLGIMKRDRKHYKLDKMQ